ncbi:GTP:AMP phosphotransferase AK3, mitochondrial [Anastrepha obliqua]|uniref:GTP:AMP phosphotransferase AK3, mitochondrial n=1 Tax=Anastrepha obliqua TaxID=95512 RepID=UPI002409C5AC|nr:GTP:AMP phosphotransferase AK3, mitochondrial [Anastrepha obliqua]XP_054746919.1 GTP:AMP phosphotransferase AK3, mitochondrial [Anastrepha obliqua]XP_054746920.1 GTP:AMP phosphotransferase AK3, mitochondrial [Anastrepha obliqua]XP_054746921.1 GTP:AMP phosphotransferase AK3, mitochondrial [Anastrepha obliqua]XP_054746922.1 GTP:AMP phosphotransferase AK3, mitochondrial [Anastrepha obliqua]XP_054746923.1 GTP:AMP phosphotransferase AK3, mitochondrial [Anastrepha obliqua]XP_054746924.1 GTP:AMP 
MLSKVFRVVMLGAPASGKGTISKRIVQKFGFVHISPGDMLRLNVLHGTDLGKKAKKYMDEGKLVPDDIVMKCVLSRITEVGNKSWLLDGFPRTLAQAERLKASEPIQAVINLEVPHDVIIERVKGRWVHLPSGRVYNVGFNDPKVPGKDDVTGEDLVQRGDDKPEVVAQRLQVYEEMLRPVMNYYQEQDLITNFKGRTTSEIWPQVEKFLAEKTRSAVAANSL